MKHKFDLTPILNNVEKAKASKINMDKKWKQEANNRRQLKLEYYRQYNKKHKAISNPVGIIIIDHETEDCKELPNITAACKYVGGKQHYQHVSWELLEQLCKESGKYSIWATANCLLDSKNTIKGFLN